VFPNSCCSFRAKSIKTRIETTVALQEFEIAGLVLEQNPSKQGLKREKILSSEQTCNPVLEQNPSKQGLKLLPCYFLD